MILDKLLEEYLHIFKEPFPLMLCRGCDDDEIIEIILQCIKDNKPYTVDTDIDY